MNHKFNMNEWYVWEQNCCPMLLIMTFNPSFKELKETFGINYNNVMVIFEEDKSGNYQGKWIFRPDEGRILGQKMIDLLLCPPYRISYSERLAKAEKALLKRAKEIQFNEELNKLSTEELVVLFEAFVKDYYNFYKFGAFVEPVQWHGEFILTSYINEMFKNKDDAHELTKINLSEILRALLTVEDDSFTIEIQKHLLECTKELDILLKHNKDIYDEINKIITLLDKNSIGNIIDIIFNSSDSKNLINKLKEHSDKYYWKRNNYYSTMFIKPEDVLSEILSNEEFCLDNVSKYYLAILEKAKKTKERQLFIKRKLFSNLPSYYSNVLEITSTIGGTMSDQRKMVVMTSNSAFDKLLKIIAERTGVSLSDIKLLIPEELKYFVEAPAEYKERFIERKKSFLVYQGNLILIDEMFGLSKNGAPIMEEPFIAEGDEVERVLHRLDKRMNLFRDTSVSRKTLQGVTAFYDQEEKIIVGKVRIIKDPKKETLNPGEILVAPSTTPDYIDAMNKCSAIITDWGGLTSHAAIISRELKKPCLINTNYATDILKDGEEIKIDFSTGSIWGGQNSHAAIMSRELSKPCIIGTNYASHVLETGDEIKINLETGEIEIIKKEGIEKNEN